MQIPKLRRKRNVKKIAECCNVNFPEVPHVVARYLYVQLQRSKGDGLTSAMSSEIALPRYHLDLIVDHFEVSSSMIYLLIWNSVDADMLSFDTSAAMLDSWCNIKLGYRYVQRCLIPAVLWKKILS